MAAFWGRLVLSFGPQPLQVRTAAALDRVAAESAKAAEAAACRERSHADISLYATEKGGWFRLELQRGDASEPEWVIWFRGRSERERLRDFLRWRGDRFGDYLDHAAEHGDLSLERRVTEEMFEAERRVKAAGQGAGGARPLRMWRGG